MSLELGQRVGNRAGVPWTETAMAPIMVPCDRRGCQAGRVGGAAGSACARRVAAGHPVVQTGQTPDREAIGVRAHPQSALVVAKVAERATLWRQEW